MCLLYVPRGIYTINYKFTLDKTLLKKEDVGKDDDGGGRLAHVTDSRVDTGGMPIEVQKDDGRMGV